MQVNLSRHQDSASERYRGSSPQRVWSHFRKTRHAQVVRVLTPLHVHLLAAAEICLWSCTTARVVVCRDHDSSQCALLTSLTFAILVNLGLRKRIHRMQSACTFPVPLRSFCLVTLSIREHDHGA